MMGGHRESPAPPRPGFGDLHTEIYAGPGAVLSIIRPALEAAAPAADSMHVIEA